MVQKYLFDIIRITRFLFSIYLPQIQAQLK